MIIFSKKESKKKKKKPMIMIKISDFYINWFSIDDNSFNSPALKIWSHPTDHIYIVSSAVFSLFMVSKFLKQDLKKIK
jgi:hypothetical protein